MTSLKTCSDSNPDLFSELHLMALPLHSDVPNEYEQTRVETPSGPSSPPASLRDQFRWFYQSERITPVSIKQILGARIPRDHGEPVVLDGQKLTTVCRFVQFERVQSFCFTVDSRRVAGGYHPGRKSVNTSPQKWVRKHHSQHLADS